MNTQQFPCQERGPPLVAESGREASPVVPATLAERQLWLAQSSSPKKVVAVGPQQPALTAAWSGMPLGQLR